MKTPFSPALVRWMTHATAMLAGIGLGALLPRGSAVPNAVSAAPRVEAKAAALKPLRDQVATAPAALGMPLPSVPRETKARPNSRLGALIDYASILSQPETLKALRKLDTEPDDPVTKLARHVLVARFAELDPQTALTYVDTLSGSEHAEQKENALSTWASKSPAAAAEYVENQVLIGGVASDDDVKVVASVASEWARRDAKAAWQWAAGLSEEVRGEALARLTSQLAASNPQAALQAVRSLETDEDRSSAMKPLAQAWAQSSPASVAAFVQSLSNESERAAAATGLLTSWMQNDPMHASSWVANLRQGAVRDAAVAAMVNAQALRNDPEAATRWAATVHDDALREQLVAQSLQRWQLHDAAAAEQWAATGGK